MPMVDGIGDEVLQVFGICIIILIFITAWKSTAIRDLPPIRAVFILDRRSQFTNDATATPAPAPAVPPDLGQNNSVNVTNTIFRQSTQAENSEDNQECQPPSTQNEVNALRLSYFSNLPNQTQNPSTSSTPTRKEATIQPQSSSEVPTEYEVEGIVEEEESEHSIRVKLKYLNDDQRIVRGNLKELLGQFKRRYFNTELSNNKNVLLIFQGRVLREDETLEAIGMYNNCVVHCLVKNGRQPEGDGRSTLAQGNSTPADWNLGPLLIATLIAVFALAWFSYWTYPHLFGITSTVLLACLTSLFILTISSFYYPHLFQSL